MTEPFLTPLKDPYPIILCQRQRFGYPWQGLPLGEKRRGEWPRVSIRIQQGCQLQESFEGFYYRETPTRVTLTRDDLRDIGLVLLLFANAAGGEF